MGMKLNVKFIAAKLYLLICSMSERYESYKVRNSACLQSRDINRNCKRLGYLQWSTRFQSKSYNDSDVLYQLLRAETDRGDVDNNPLRMSIKQKSKDGIV